jgi:hypothetical protein
MRSLGLILTTAAALFCVFLLYVHLATPPPRMDVTDAAGPATLPVSVKDQPYAAGAWSNMYDRDGQLYGRLRSQVCVPRPDGSGQWDLTNPEAEFYQRDGQVAHLTASDGVVRLGEQTHQQNLGNGPVDPPSEGILHNVNLYLFSSVDARDHNDPELTIHLNNAQFDADTYRIYTIAEGSIPADQVPVTVHGRDMEFEGAGLLLSWNGQAHQLKSMLIPHATRLRLLNSQSRSTQPGGQPGRSTTAAPAGTPSPVHVYLATFGGPVRVTQSGQDRILSKGMTVTASTGHAESNAPATDSTTTAAHDSSGSATQRADQPVDVFWTGSMLVVPADTVAAGMKPGSAIVRFTDDVRVREDSMQLFGYQLQYDTASAHGAAVGSADQPLRIKFLNRNGSPSGNVSAQQADYWQNGQRVRFSGPGNGNFADPDKPAEMLRVAWDEFCGLTFTGSTDQMQIQHAQLRGNAHVSDGPATGPQRLNLWGRQIDADFAPSATPTKKKFSASAAGRGSPNATLTRIIATTDARCIIHDEKEPDRLISSDILNVEMAADSAGKPYPRFVTADGNVHSAQDEQELWSHHLDAAVVPAPPLRKAAPGKGSGEDRYQLSSLLATGDVRLRNKAGNSASADTLMMQQRDDQPQITLLGTPWATLSGDDRTLKGPRIVFRPSDHWAMVSGPGLVEGLSAQKPGKPPQPIHAQWTHSATVVAEQNQIDIEGGVEADTTEASGYKNIATSDQALLTLTGTPATRPSSKSSNNSLGEARFDLLQGKQVRFVSLRGQNRGTSYGAAIQSTLPAADGSVLRREFIEGDQIDADLPAQRMTIPGPGRMLLENHGNPTAHDNDSTLGSRGDTAFVWTKRFTFDQLAREAVIEGSVEIKHQPAAGGKGSSAPTTLWADRVTADFVPSSSKGQQQTDESSALVLKQVQATGHVWIETGAKLVHAKLVTYDPQTDWLTADGTTDEPVIVTDDKNHSEQTFEGIRYNIRTNEFIASHVSGSGRQ